MLHAEGMAGLVESQVPTVCEKRKNAVMCDLSSIDIGDCLHVTNLTWLAKKKE